MDELNSANGNLANPDIFSPNTSHSCSSPVKLVCHRNRHFSHCRDCHIDYLSLLLVFSGFCFFVFQEKLAHLDLVSRSGLRDISSGSRV
jgi:hypothetical protein